MDNLATIAEQFKPHGRIIDIRRLGNGNINNTFLVTLDSGENNHFVLQSINARVFPRPDLIMRNMRAFTDHINHRLVHTPMIAGRRWEIPGILTTKDGQDFWQDLDGSCWRAISYIENSRSFDTVKEIDHAREVGCALGMFHSLISDLSPDRLEDTLEGFHITPRYLKQYKDVISKCSTDNSDKINYCMKFVSERSALADVLEDAKAQGRLCLRPIHGDPKVDNIMIDNATGQAISIVDLDTVKPGLVHYDIGDCMRSGCNPLGEETEQFDAVFFDPDLCKAILDGYVSVAKGFLTGNDYDYMYDAIRLMSFELGMRFFTDYLAGNVYFKAKHQKHNLFRALVQFRLTESIESQETAIRAIIQDLR